MCRSRDSCSPEKLLGLRKALAFASVRDQRALFNDMVVRCRLANEVPDTQAIQEFERKMSDFETAISAEGDPQRVDALAQQVLSQSSFRAHVCPLSEIYTTALLSIEAMKDWGVPASNLTVFQQLLNEKIKDTNVATEARSALRAILKENEIMARYTDDTERELKKLSWQLVYWTVGLIISAGIALLFADRFPTLFVLSVLLSGAAGSCVSVLFRLPTTESPSSAISVSLVRRSLGRIAAGLIATVTGSALLAWGILPIAVNNISFSGALSACSSVSAPTCSNTFLLIVFAVPMIFGFSELALKKVLERFFDSSGSSPDKTT